ncbi:MAG: DUF3109 family protein [Ignavibacteria bacterium]|nr:DUF3109 family protein [Ignavibacteria bacterium]
MEKFIIDNRIFSVKFSCDLNKCKGACCTLKGAGGAPLLDEEVNIIRKNLKIAKKYLSEVNIKCIEKDGFLEGSTGDYAIRSVNDEQCVFSYYEDEIAKCSFQKAFNNNETYFRKPVSCHLFPIRISGDKRNILRYEEINECKDALDKGKAENVSVFEFAKDSLVREYGEDFYDDLREKYCNE